MIRRPPRSTLSSSSAASDVYKRQVTVVDHPLVQHKLTLMRRKEASTAEFRKLLREIGLFLGYEALRDLPLGKIQIDTPICTMEAPVLCVDTCLLYTSPSPRDRTRSRMPSSA
eukprot:TRINITY_DN18342_c0_g1_i2.p1 TRINITY_DN18342_c0_g1~~TRINITY_DN18342_c0_g1_i2.p1  ORF type:complete len:113 (+),score=19.90 TRINITY_DN18342_c0_g1_i2:101-439(+)